MAVERLGVEPLGPGPSLSRSSRLLSQTRGEKPPQPRVSGATSRASDLAVPRAPAITWPAPCAPARLRHFRPAHWQRRRRRRRGGRGEEGAARVARRGGALRAPRDLDRSAPPRPGVAGSPDRRGERRGRCRRRVRTWQQPGGASLAGPPAGRRRPQSRGSLPAGSSRFWAAQARLSNPRPCLCSLPALPTSLLCRCSGSAQVQSARWTGWMVAGSPVPLLTKQSWFWGDRLSGCHLSGRGQAQAKVSSELGSAVNLWLGSV